jgi:transposase
MLKVSQNCALKGAHRPIDLTLLLMCCRGVKLIYLPPYSPDFNPIEECFSYMKSVIRRYGAEFRAAVETKDPAAVTGFISDTLTTVTSEHAKGWFRHSNYL